MKSLTHKSLIFSAALGVLAAPAKADDLSALKKELAALKKLTEMQQKQIKALETKLEGLVEEKDEDAVKLGAKTSGAAFNPNFSVILDGVAYRDGKKGGGGELLEQAAGFEAANLAGGHSHGELGAGFNLRSTELALSGAIDPYFDAKVQAVLSGEEAEVEEAYLTTRKLPSGLKVKMGRFLSDIGQQNSKHTHQFDFADGAQVYDRLLGGGIVENGLQLTWTPKSNTYTLLGLELLDGRNGAVSGYTGELSVDPGTGPVTIPFRQRSGPRLATAFLKVAPNIGRHSELYTGLFAGLAATHQENQGSTRFLEGNAGFWGVDFKYLHDRPGPGGDGDLTFQGEYIRRRKDLRVLENFNNPAETGLSDDRTQDGLYLQGLYGVAPNWQAGLRWDAVGMTNDVKAPGQNPNPGSTTRLSTVINYRPTEFSRLLFQWSRPSVALPAGGRNTFNQFYFGYQFSLGSHGAHKF